MGAVSLAALGLIAVSAAGGARESSAATSAIALQPASQVVTVGDTVKVDVRVENVTDLGAWEVIIKYDRSVLEWLSFTSTSFLSSTGRQTNCPGYIIDDVAGTVQFGCNSPNATPAGPAGSSVVATASFTAKGIGTSDLEMMKGELAKPEGASCCGLPDLHEGAVSVVADGDEDSAPLPPTPTPNPSKRTVRRPANAPPVLSLEDPASAGSDPALAGATSVPSTPGAGAISGQGTGAGRGQVSGAGTGSSGASRAGGPVAGAGPGPQEGSSDRLYAVAAVLAMVGVTLALSGYRHRFSARRK